jgi:hypothetical protein
MVLIYIWSMDSEDKSTHKLAYTVHKLKKLEDIFDHFGYKVRYEKGNFQGGYCLVLDKKVVVLNKFSDTESRINILLEIAESQDFLAKCDDTKMVKFLQSQLFISPKIDPS